jgi:hypothetical protein
MTMPSDLLDDPVEPVEPIEPVEPVEPIEPVEPVVPPKKDRFKADLLKQKDLNADLTAKIAELEKQKDDARTNKLKEQEKFKELYEESEEKRLEAEEKANNLTDAIGIDKKYTAVKTKALQMGIRKEALDDLDLLDLDDLIVERTSTGRTTVLGVTEFVENMKITRPHWFGKKSAALNPGDPEVITSDGTVTIEMVMKAEKGYKKSGDSTVYLKLLKQYKKQSA